MIAATPEPPYVAVLFTAERIVGDDEVYDRTAEELRALAARQPGFLGVESAGATFEITISYWSTDEHARQWKQVAEHLAAQRLGREHWYRHYRVRVAQVRRDYGT